MARTYGEIVEESFSEVFSIASGDETVFIDIGSGHGRIVISAVREYGCQHAIGIEKYREPQEICDGLYKALPQETQHKITFRLEDINDTDLLQCLIGFSFSHLLIFCNNLAFTQGTLNRQVSSPAARKSRSMQLSLLFKSKGLKESKQDCPWEASSD